MLKRTLSITKGKGSVGHNSRKFFAENVDQERSKNNICFVNQDIKEAYHFLFEEALARFNAKQKRNDRKIENYYEKIRTSRQEKLFHEVIVQVGDMETMSATGEYAELGKTILEEYMEGFSVRNQGLHVFSAYLHMDEATPHLHIDFIPYTTGSKRGLDTRVSLKQALEKLGFKSTSAKDTELIQWQNSEKEQLSKIMLAHGVE
ncbi:MAG: plasmid recombination protein [Eubacteriales bacterium]